MPPLVSVVVPSYNSASTLRECLKSIQNQDYADIEIIVIDDNSKDKSVEIAEKFHARVIRNEQNMGAAEARNIGARKAKGQALLFVDSDVVLENGLISKAVNYMTEHREVDAVVGVFNPKNRFRNFASQYKHLYLCYYFKKQDLKVHYLNTSFTMVRKKVFSEFNGFDAGISKSISEDIELGMRMAESGKVIHQLKDLQVEHLKKYSFWEFIRTDLRRSRRIFRLFLKKKLLKQTEGKESYGLKPINIYASIPFPFLIIIFAVLQLLYPSTIFISLFLVFNAIFIGLNMDYWIFLLRERGLIFASRSTFITFLDMLIMSVGSFIGLISFLLGK